MPDFEDFRVEHDFPTIGHRVLLLNARQIELGAEPARLILLAMEDITAHRPRHEKPGRSHEQEEEHGFGTAASE